MEERTITKEEVRYIMSKMKEGEAAGEDDKVVEILKSVEGIAIEKITNIANEIYNKGNSPSQMKKSMLVLIPKKAGTLE